MKLKQLIKEEKNVYTIKDYKFSWKRESKATGKWRSFQQDELRGYILKTNNDKFGKEEIGYLINVSKGNHVKDQSQQWQVMFVAKGNNIILKNKFDYNNVENAKRFAEQAFVQIMNSENNDIKNRILDLNRLNREMFL